MSRRASSHRLTVYHCITEFNRQTKEWSWHYEKTTLKVSDPHGPKVSHNTIDLSIPHSCPLILESNMDFEDRLANMSDEDYERYLRLKRI